MTIEEQLKQEILVKYKSVRAFTNTFGIPYSTLDSVFKRGISNAGISTMLRIFDALNLDIESIKDGCLRYKDKRPGPSPSTDESAPEKGPISLEQSNVLLTALGLLQEDGELSHDDLMFLEHIMGLLEAWFRKGH